MQTRPLGEFFLRNSKTRPFPPDGGAQVSLQIGFRLLMVFHAERSPTIAPFTSLLRRFPREVLRIRLRR